MYLKLFLSDCNLNWESQHKEQIHDQNFPPISQFYLLYNE